MLELMLQLGQIFISFALEVILLEIWTRNNLRIRKVKPFNEFSVELDFLNKIENIAFHSEKKHILKKTIVERLVIGA